jgi:hypothetical protein
VLTNNTILVGGGVVYKRLKNKKFRWFITKQSEDSDWEIPKILVRKGESSVRAVLRMTGEQAGMGCRVLEEAGRAGDSTLVNGKSVPRKIIYYLTKQKTEGEVLGFSDYLWLDYSKAQRKLSSKREKEMLRSANKELKNWLKKRNKEKKIG